MPAARSTPLAFMQPGGARRWLKLEVISLVPPRVGHSPGGATDRGAGGGAGGPVRLLIICHDLTAALRQTTRKVERKAHSAINHVRSTPLAPRAPVWTVSGEGGGADAARAHA